MEIKYLLDTNAIIELWREKNKIIEEIQNTNKIVVLKEVLDELSKKEKKTYKGNEVLSERFIKLLPFIIEINKDEINDFYANINIKKSTKGHFYFKDNKLSNIDLLLLFTIKENEDLILVTDDKKLLNTVKEILGENRAINVVKFKMDNFIEGDLPYEKK